MSESGSASEWDSASKRVAHLLTPGYDALQIDTSTPQTARMYNYYLGGHDNYEVDRDAAEQILAVFPQLRAITRANRAFLGRAVRHVASAGVRQFLDIGTGIPGPGNTGEVAHAIAPQAHVVYVDNDPIVMAHASALLAGSDPARTTVVHADLRYPEAILEHPQVRAVLDFNQPVAILLVAVLHFIRDDEDPEGIVRRLMQATAPGSYLVLSHATFEGESELAEETSRVSERVNSPINLRSRAQIARFFDGLQLVEPGIVQQPWWRPDEEITADPTQNWGYGAVATRGHTYQ